MKDSISYYKRFVITPLIISLIGSIVWIIYSNRNYKSEWLTADSVLLMLSISVFIYCMLLCSFCSTILLLHKKGVKNTVLELICWFLFPIGFIITVIVHEDIPRMIIEFGLNEQVIIFFILNVPILFSLVIGYLSYKKRNKQLFNITPNHV